MPALAYRRPAPLRSTVQDPNHVQTLAPDAPRVRLGRA
nr:MAG TPA: hypothetical protein [Caudoviricetes sp.]